MHEELIIYSGNRRNPSSALILVHGRGGTAEDILTLADDLEVGDFLLAAPQATNNSWYPQSFLAPISQNQPWLSSALRLLETVVAGIEKRGIEKDRIFFLGFSQGACLSMEFAARNAFRYGGLVAFSGGLIGDDIYREHYKGDFGQMPVFIGSSEPDQHIPVERVFASSEVFRELGAAVKEKIYPRLGHSINRDEIDQANTHVFRS